MTVCPVGFFLFLYRGSGPDVQQPWRAGRCLAVFPVPRAGVKVAGGGGQEVLLSKPRFPWMDGNTQSASSVLLFVTWSNQKRGPGWEGSSWHACSEASCLRAWFPFTQWKEKGVLEASRWTGMSKAIPAAQLVACSSPSVRHAVDCPYRWTRRYRIRADPSVPREDGIQRLFCDPSAVCLSREVGCYLLRLNDNCNTLITSVGSTS